jgi:hypothetical protein
MRALKLALVAAFLALSTFGASASDADFVLVNRTRYQIDEVYVSPTKSGNWGKDIMGSDSLANREKVTIKFPHSSTACHFDLKVVYHDGDVATWNDFNLCEIDTITLTYNPTTDKTTATWE